MGNLCMQTEGLTFPDIPTRTPDWLSLVVAISDVLTEEVRMAHGFASLSGVYFGQSEASCLTAIDRLRAAVRNSDNSEWVVL